MSNTGSEFRIRSKASNHQDNYPGISGHGLFLRPCYQARRGNTPDGYLWPFFCFGLSLRLVLFTSAVVPLCVKLQNGNRSTRLRSVGSPAKKISLLTLKYLEEKLEIDYSISPRNCITEMWSLHCPSSLPCSMGTSPRSSCQKP